MTQAREREHCYNREDLFEIPGKKQLTKSTNPVRNKVRVLLTEPVQKRVGVSRQGGLGRQKVRPADIQAHPLIIAPLVNMILCHLVRVCIAQVRHTCIGIN